MYFLLGHGAFSSLPLLAKPPPGLVLFLNPSSLHLFFQRKKHIFQTNPFMPQRSLQTLQLNVEKNHIKSSLPNSCISSKYLHHLTR